MPDPRFYEALGPATLAELAATTGATLADPAMGARLLTGVAPLGSAKAGDLAYLGDRRYADALHSTGAGACLVRSADAERVPAGCVALVCPQPQVGYARAAARLYRPRSHLAEAPAVHPEAEIEAGVHIAQGAVVGPGARLGAGTVIGPGAVVGPGVSIGRGCRVGANAVIGFALIGDRVIVHAGTVIGEPGFGVAGDRAGAVDVPQLGRVILQDGVTIGACSCIDRGAWDDTVIGENTKIDNLVQIAHNVRIGRNCVLAAHTGISGSVTVGDGAMFGGRAGVADHIEIGAGARIGAAAAVMKSVPARQTWAGAPARPLRSWLRESAWLARAAHGRPDLKGSESDE